MKSEIFKAFSPLEIGDILATTKTAAGKIGRRIPQGSLIIITGDIEVQKVTDIAMTHYLKDKKTAFAYELDNSGVYEKIKILTPEEK